MERKTPQSLAEYLGVATPQNPDPDPFPTEGVSPQEICTTILRSQEFRTYLLHSLTLGTLPPAVLMRIMDVAGWPKGVARIEHTGPDGKPIETVTQIRRIVVTANDVDDDDDEKAVSKVTTH